MNLIYPQKLNKGDTLGVAAPASPFDREYFEKGVRALEAMGFDVFIPDAVWDVTGFLAGTDEHRASALHDLFENPDIQGIVCARGGYGTLRLLDRLDFGTIRNNPKPFIGFSDVTALLSVFHQFAGLISYHGPVVCSLASSDDASLASFESILKTGEGSIDAEDGTVIRPGTAEGILKGGNLATLCHLAGTGYAPDFNGSILMLEDVGEAPYKVDRMLTQMKMAGFFENIRAVVGGRFEGCGQAQDIQAVFSHAFGDLDIPVAFNFNFGHGTVNRSFPVGVPARFDTDSLSVVF